MREEVTVIQNFIDGRFRESKQHIDSFNPATGQVNARVPDSTQEDVDAAVESAQRAAKGWSTTGVPQRAAVMQRIADLLESKLDDFAIAESRDQGKPCWLARMVDIPRAVHNFKFFASAISHFGNESTSQNHLGVVNYTVHTPIGIAGQITPWNLPLYLLTFKIAPAIAAGNCVICKPSEMTSVTAWMLCSILSEAGLPGGVVNMIFGTGPNAGSHIVLHPKIPVISFTGSTKVGEFIQEKTAPFCKKLSLELGGKNAALVFEDCDLDKCVPTCIRSSFSNQGEICLCTSRIFVQRSIYEEFVSRFVELTRKLKVGDPEDEETNVGALISKDHLNKVKGYVKIGADEGGKILCGEGVDDALDLPDRCKEGYFMRPTVIAGLKDSARCMQEEIFGPVTCITPFESEEEVLERANGVRYGLCATVWTENSSRIHRLAPKLEVGTVWCNCWLIRDLNMPFGGTKLSGIGREGFKDSLEFYTEAKTVCVKHS